MKTLSLRAMATGQAALSGGSSVTGDHVRQSSLVSIATLEEASTPLARTRVKPPAGEIDMHFGALSPDTRRTWLQIAVQLGVVRAVGDGGTVQGGVG